MIRKAMIAFGLAMLAAGNAQAQKLEYDCDTAAGHFSELKLLDGSTSITGEITALGFYKDRTYAPTVNAFFAAPDDSWSVRLSLTGLVQTGPGMMTGALQLKRDGKPEEINLGIFDARRPIAFSMTIGADGHGTATLGGKSRDFPVPAGAATARVSCSTGDFLYTNLAFAR